MFFTILGTAPTGPAASHRYDAIEAVKCAIQMLAKGYADVVIVDSSNGDKAYTPTEFAQFYADAKNKRKGQDVDPSIRAGRT
jgi:hypothetical protein